jgi:general secretion pathway protein G
MKRGFTLIETLIVITLIGILLGIIVPEYRRSVTRAREAVLKEDLFVLRDAINKHFFDKKGYPASLEDLVSARYIHAVPVDPITRQSDWQLIQYAPPEGEEFDINEEEGIIDVKSMATGTALDGSKYNEW